MDSVMKSIDWEESSFKSTNGALNLRFDLIEKIIWENLPVTVKELAHNPLEVALEAV
jgi:type IV secretory pathway TrbF-like protein